MRPPRTTWADWIGKAAFAGLFVYVGLTALGSLWWPMGRDQGIFAWVGDVILSGGAPYRDAWEVKGPATHYTYAAVQGLFGRNFWGLRVFDLALLAVATVALWRLVRRRADRFSAHMAALLFPWVYLGRSYWNVAQPDGWAAMLLLIALALMMPEGRIGNARRTIAGLLIGLAVMYKFFFVVFILPVAWFDLAATPATLRRRAAKLAVLTGACLVVVCLFLVWLALQGVLAEFADIQFNFNRTVHAGKHHWSLSKVLYDTLRYVPRLGFRDALLLLSLGIAPISLWHRQRTLLGALLLFLLLALACVVVQNKAFAHHVWPMVVPMVILAAIGMGQIRRALLDWPAVSPGGSRLAEIALLASFAWYVQAIGPGINVDGWRACVFGTLSKAEYYDRFQYYENDIRYSVFEPIQMADYLRQRTGEGDEILVWGFDPLINYASGRKSPTRFGFNYPLVEAPGTVFEERYRREFIEEFTARPPAYVVVVHRDAFSLLTKTSKEFFEEFTELSSYVKEHYVLESQNERYHVWRRRGN